MVKGGHLTASKEETAAAEEIARVRVKVWIASGVIAFFAMIVWCGPLRHNRWWSFLRNCSLLPSPGTLCNASRARPE